jgi:hypothetical protein
LAKIVKKIRRNINKKKQEPIKEIEATDVYEKMESALNNLGYVQVIDVTLPSVDRVKILLRVHSDRDWLPLISLILKEEEESKKDTENSWRVHVCKQYIINSETKKLAYVWNMVVQSEQLKFALRSLLLLISMVSRSGVSLVSQDKASDFKPVAINDVAFKGPVSNAAVASRVLEEGEELEYYPLAGSPGRNKPSVSLLAPSGSRKGAHKIGGKHGF